MKHQLPPGPKEGKLKIMRRMAADYIGFFHWLHENYGDVVYFEVPTGKHCALFTADLVDELLVEKTDSLKVLHPRTSFEVMQAPCLARMPAGEEQGRLKELLRTAFTPERTRALKQVAAEEANHLADGLEEGPVDLRGRLERFTWGALTTSIVGAGRELSPDVALPTLKAVKLNFIVFAMPGYSLLRRLPLPHDMKARKAIRALDEVTYREIAAARTSDETGASLISHMVQATDRGESDWKFGNDSEIRDEAYGMLFGALDGPVHALTHAPFHLKWNPDVRERLEVEVQQVIGGRPLAGDDLDRLPYTQAVCKELLRLHPPAPLLVPREAVEDTTLGGYSIPKGTLVDLVIHVIHRRSDYWEDHEAFRPERWLDGGQECPRNGFIPFSIEPKKCRGADLATNIIVAALAALAQRWRLEPESDDFPPAGLSAGAFSGAVPATVTSRTA